MTSAAVEAAPKPERMGSWGVVIGWGSKIVNERQLFSEFQVVFARQKIGFVDWHVMFGREDGQFAILVGEQGILEVWDGEA